MWLYIGMLSVALVIAINDINEKKMIVSIGKDRIINERIMLSALLMYCCLFILTAFRDRTVGNDTISYIGMFERISINGIYTNLSSRIEIGFQTYCFILAKISDNPRILLIVSAIICYGITGFFIFKHSNSQGVIVAIFIPLMFKNFCSGLRQALAFSICLIAYMVIKKGKNVFGAVLIIIAATFHITALIGLLYYVIPFLTRGKKTSLSLIAVIVVVALLIRYTGLYNFISRYSSYYEGYYNERGQAKIGFWSCLLTLITSIFSILIYFAIKKRKNVNDYGEWNSDETVWFGYMMICISIINFFINNSSRFLWYFELPFYVSLVNQAAELEPRDKNRFLIPLIVLCGMTMIVGMILRPYYFSLVPYKFWTS